MPLALCSMEVGKARELVEVGDLASMRRGRLGERWQQGSSSVPFLGGFVQRFVILVELLFERLGGLAVSASLALSRFEMIESAPAIAKVEEASSLRKTSVISERWLAGSA